MAEITLAPKGTGKKMSKTTKVVLIGIVILVIAGVAYYFWNENKKAEKKTDAPTGKATEELAAV